jgi:hypothetical protein
MNEAKFSGRRVVTRMNEQGRSVIGLDGSPAETIEFSLGGGLRRYGPISPGRSTARALPTWALGPFAWARPRAA